MNPYSINGIVKSRNNESNRPLTTKYPELGMIQPVLTATTSSPIPLELRRTGGAEYNHPVIFAMMAIITKKTDT
jgi:hypothetical protein